MHKDFHSIEATLRPLVDYFNTYFESSIKEF